MTHIGTSIKWFRAQANYVLGRYLNSILLRSGSWYLGATIIQRGLNFFSIVLFTRLLTPEQFGTVSIFTPWLTIFAATITLNLYSAATPGRHDFNDEDFRKFVSAVNVLGFLVSISALLMVVIVPDSITQSVFDLNKLYLIIAIVIAAFELPINTTFTAWQMRYQYGIYCVVSSLYALAKIVLSYVMIVLSLQLLNGDRALERVAGIALSSLVLGSYLLGRSILKGKTLIDISYWRYALRYSIPLIPHVLSGLILAQFDRILIDRYVGRSEAGLYSFAYQIGDLVYILWVASNAAWVPWFFEQAEKKSHSLIRTRATQYVWGFAGLTALAILIGPSFVTWIAPGQYWVTKMVVPIIMCGNFFIMGYSLYANVEFYEKKTIYVSAGTAFSAFSNIFLNILFLSIFFCFMAAF